MSLIILSMKTILLLFVVSFLIKISHYGVQGDWPVSKDGEIDLEKQLKILNKPSIKTIQTEEGDTIDCVDIHKQPALDHPSLKNHKIQMKPITQPRASINETEVIHLKSGFKLVDCPKGTVPIRRTRKKDLVRAKSFFKSYPSSINEITKIFPGQHVAIRRSKYTEFTNAYYGVHGYIITANPKVRRDDQYSTSQLWVEGGPPYQLSTLQAGWIVAPQLFGDNLTRFFVYSSTDKRHIRGCYNLLCQGFVQVHPKYVVGTTVTPISVYKGDQYALHLSIYQEVNGTGDWWLEANNGDLIGYWPKNLFPNLQNGAQFVAWGGFVQGRPEDPSPEMGNGHFPNHEYREACSMVHLQVVDHNGNLIDTNERNFENVVDNPNCYKLEYDGFIGSQRYSFLFGGPGGDKCGS